MKLLSKNVNLNCPNSNNNNINFWSYLQDNHSSTSILISPFFLKLSRQFLKRDLFRYFSRKVKKVLKRQKEDFLRGQLHCKQKDQFSHLRWNWFVNKIVKAMKTFSFCNGHNGKIILDVVALVSVLMMILLILFVWD